jgi:hypothetical protein
MEYIETTTRITTKLISIFYLIYKLTSVQEKRRFGNRYRKWKMWLIAPPRYNRRVILASFKPPLACIQNI